MKFRLNRIIEQKVEGQICFLYEFGLDITQPNIKENNLIAAAINILMKSKDEYYQVDISYDLQLTGEK